MDVEADTAWRASIYKLICMDVSVFLVFFYSLHIFYVFVLPEGGKRNFEILTKACSKYDSALPLSFVLGFYVSVIMGRWWNQYTAIPMPDSIAITVSATIQGKDETSKLMRRTILRYVCLSITMTFSLICPRVKYRFPTTAHFVDAGLLQKSEKEILDELDEKFPKYPKHWVPIVWAASVVTKAKKGNRIIADHAVKTLLDKLDAIRASCGTLLKYDGICVPLVYTQVVTLVTYSYFLTALVGDQWFMTDAFSENGKNDRIYFPLFTLLKIFLYLGWLKVALSLINPFGDDDDDFDINSMVDRNLQVSYCIVDEMMKSNPKIIKDMYWDEVIPHEVPYTKKAAEAEAHRTGFSEPSTAHIEVSLEDQKLVRNPSMVENGTNSKRCSSVLEHELQGLVQ